MVVPEHDHDGESGIENEGRSGVTTPHLFVTVLNLLLAAERARNNGVHPKSDR
jgi:hypothetical protein